MFCEWRYFRNREDLVIRLDGEEVAAHRLVECGESRKHIADVGVRVAGRGS